MVSGIVYVFMGCVVRDWSCAVEFTITMGVGPTGALTTIGCLIISRILLKIGWKVFACVSACEIISQADHPFNSYDQKSKCSIHLPYWMRLIRFHMKILPASDAESDYTIRCTWVLSLHLYR